MKNKYMYMLSAVLFALVSCTSDSSSQQKETVKKADGQTAALPAPGKSKTKFSKVIGWAKGEAPTAPAGFTVTRFAENIKSPRNILVAPNGDVFVALSNSERSVGEKIAGAVIGKSKSEVPGESANTILLYRDTDGDMHPDQAHIFLTGLNQPYGMAIIGNWFYVANTDGVWRYSYKTGANSPASDGVKIVTLPAGGYNNHWTRNLLPNANGSKLYISVGSASNVAEHGMEYEVRRAAILEVNPDGSGERLYGSGLRNPVGMDWAPGTGMLWTAVNERDGLGDDLVPDYITSVKPGGFYGWPYSYFGQHEDPRMKGQGADLVAKAIVPDVPVGSHTASLGLAFYKGDNFPAKYRGGAFIGQHGSWNRSELAGYKVAFVPFKNGKQAGPMEDFLTGFIADTEKGTVHGRPVGVAQLKDGSLLVADDVSGIVWRVAAK